MFEFVYITQYEAKLEWARFIGLTGVRQPAYFTSYRPNQNHDGGTVWPDEGILHHAEGVALMPGNIELSATEVSLVNTMSRETALRSYVNSVKDRYNYVLIDCIPSFGMLTINALAATDSVIIPVQAHYLPAKGMTQLLQTIASVREQINPKLTIDGVLLTMVDNRTNFAKDISFILRRDYGDRLHIFQTEIPLSIHATETSAEGKSIYMHDPHGIAAKAYRAFTKEVQDIGKEQSKRQHKTDISR